MNENFYQNDDEIDLFELFEILIKQWKIILITILIGFLLALVYINFTNPKYEALALIKVGQIGTIDFEILPVEEPSISIERINSVYFKDIVTNELKNISFELFPKDEGQYFKYKSSILKNSDSNIPLIQLEVTGESPQIIEKVIELVVENLKEAHQQLNFLYLDKYKKELDQIILKINSNIEEFKGIDELLNKATNEEEKISTLLMEIFRIQKERELYQLEQQRMKISTILRPPFTTPTSLYINKMDSDNQIHPRKLLILSLGIIGSAFLGVFLVLIKNGWVKYNQRNKRTNI